MGEKREKREKSRRNMLARIKKKIMCKLKRNKPKKKCRLKQNRKSK